MSIIQGRKKLLIIGSATLGLCLAAIMPALVAEPANAQSELAIETTPESQTRLLRRQNIVRIHPNSVQPETTFTVQGVGTVSKAPDIAIISGGVSSRADTASSAMAINRRTMNNVFATLKSAGIEGRDLQTSNLSLQAEYDYSNRQNGAPARLIGYQASNQLTMKVRDLDILGEVLDALVRAGGNTFSGLNFALSDPSLARDEARRLALRDARHKAELYAEEAGYQVKRIITLEEGGGNNAIPFRQAAMRMAENDAATPVAGGEVSYTMRVTVVFELTDRLEPAA